MEKISLVGKATIALKEIKQSPMVDHPFYDAYHNMIARCYRPNHLKYKTIGGRGISVCQRWRSSFWHFVEDMGPKPDPSYLLYRKNSQGNYDPDNVRWGTIKEWSNSRGNHHFLTINGRTQTIAQWAEEANLDQNVIASRVKAEWPEGKILAAVGTARKITSKPRPERSKYWGEKGKHPLYKTWQSIINRCRNKKSPYHGKLGIRMCDRWLNSFWDFVQDVGEKPGPKYSLDRYPDRCGHYEPGNVRWATRSEQQNNRKDNRLVTVEGRTQTVSQWALEIGISSSAIWGRLNNNWSDERAIKTPFVARGPII